jgi:signal transduction histidine kinase/DNA-binding response OmpR family regulator
MRLGGPDVADKQKILIVDDRRNNLVALRLVLSGVDAEIFEATSGNQALAATLDHDFALAILDVQMPGMSGYELAEHLRGDDKTSRIPIVFLTAAYADEQHVFRGYEAGGVDYLTKPYPPEVLRGKVNVFLQMARYRREVEMHSDHLEALVAERTATLNVRVREIKCLYAVSSLLAESGGSLDESLKAVVDLLPTGWPYPEIAGAKVVLAGEEFKSDDCRETPWKLSADILVQEATLGSVEVCYLDERPALDEGPFPREERDFIIDLARHLGIMVERKRAEGALLAANVELTRHAALTSAFVATVSHELRTPLAITSEAISLVLDEIAGPTTDQQKDVLGTAARNLDRLVRIINDLLDIGRLDAGMMPRQCAPVDIVALARQVVSDFQPQASKKHIELRTTTSAERIELVLDPDKVVEIFDNLIANAITFAETGHVEVQLHERDDAVECVVADTGVGISEADLPYVFDKFQQFGRVCGQGPKGTGLGLAIVKGLVELHRGTIRVVSKVGEGTAFTFVLPKCSRAGVVAAELGSPCEVG